MPEPTSTSFIPKRNPAQKENRPGRRKVYVGTIVIRILFFAAVVAAGGVYAYERTLNSNLEAEIFKLNNAISTFNETEMQRVLAFDNKLSQVKYRLDHAASVVALLEAIENSTVEEVQITQLSLERTNDKNFTIETSLKTPSFDIALFQRQVLEETDTLLVSAVSDLNLQNTPPSDPLFSLGQTVADEVVVSFKASLSVDVDKVPHTVNSTSLPLVPPVLDGIEQFTDGAVLETETNPEGIVEGATNSNEI